MEASASAGNSSSGCEICTNNEEWQKSYATQLETVVSNGMAIYETEMREKFENLCKVESEKHKAEIVVWQNRCNDLEDELQKRDERNKELLSDAMNKNMEFADVIKSTMEDSEKNERSMKQKISYLEEKLEQGGNPDDKTVFRLRYKIGQLEKELKRLNEESIDTALEQAEKERQLEKVSAQKTSQLDADIKAYKKKFEADMYAINYENEKLKEEIIKILDDSKQNEEDLMRNVESLEEKLEKAKHELLVDETTIDRLLLKNQQLEESEVPELKSQVEQLEKEVERLNGEWMKSTQALVEKKNIAGFVPKQTLQEAQKTIESCQASMMMQVEQYLKQISELKTQLEASEKKFKAQTIAKKYNNDVKEKKMKELESELEQEKRAAETELSFQLNRIKGLKTDIQEQEILVSKTKNENEFYQNLIHSLQQELQDNEDSVNSLKKDFQEQILFQQNLTSQKLVEIENLNRENAERMEIIANLKAQLHVTDNVHYVNSKSVEQAFDQPMAKRPRPPNNEMPEEREQGTSQPLSEQNDDENDVEMDEYEENDVSKQLNLIASELDEFEKLKKKNDENEAIIKTLQKQFFTDNLRFEEEMQTQQDINEQLKSQLAAAASLKQELRQYETRVLWQQQKLTEAEVSIGKLKKQILELQNPTQQKDEDFEKLETESSQISLSNTIQDLRKQLELKEAAAIEIIEELNEKIAAQETFTSNLEKQLKDNEAASNTAINELEEQIRVLQERATQASVYFETKKREHARYYVGTIHDLEEELRNKETEHEAALRDLTEAEKPVRSSRNDLKKLKEENEKHQKTIQSLQQQLKKNLEASDLAIKKINEQIEAQQQLARSKQVEHDEEVRVMRKEMEENEDSASSDIRRLQGQVMASEATKARRLQELQQLKRENSVQLETIRALDRRILEKTVADSHVINEVKGQIDAREINSKVMKVENERLLKENERLREEVMRKDTDVADLSQHLLGQANALALQMAEVEKLKNENANNRNNVLELQKNFEKTQTADNQTINKLKGQINAQRNVANVESVRDLQDQLRETKIRYSQIVDDMRKHSQMQQAQISEKEADYKKISNQVSHYLDTIHNLQMRIKSIETNSDAVTRDLEEKLLAKQREVIQLTADLVRLRTENAQEQESIQSLSDETADTERQDLERILEDHRDQIGRQMQKLEYAAATITQLRQENDEIQQRFLAEIQTSSGHVAAIETLKSEHHISMENLKAKNSSQLLSILSLQDQLSERNAALKALENLTGENSRLQDSIQTLQKQISEMTLEDSKLKEQIELQHANISQKESDNAMLWDQVNGHLNTIKNLESSLKTNHGVASSTICGLNEKILAQQRQESLNKQKFETMEKENAHYLETIRALHSQISTFNPVQLENQLNVAEMTIAQLRREGHRTEQRLLLEIKSLADQLVSSDKWAENQEEELNDTIRALQEKLKSSWAEMSKMADQVKKISNLENKNWALEAKLKNSNSDVMRLKDELAKVESNANELKKQYEKKVKMMGEQIQKLVDALKTQKPAITEEEKMILELESSVAEKSE